MGMKLLFTIWSALISLPMNTVVFCSHPPLLSPKAISFIPCGAKTQKKRNVTVVLGDNTVGKTTIAQAFRWVLYGAVLTERGKQQEDYQLLNNDGCEQ